MEKQSVLSTVVRMSAVMLVLCGLAYPAVVTGLAQIVMPGRADGSLIYNEEHEVIGSKLIGQQFQDSRFFHGRVSSIAYQSKESGSNNYAPSNMDMIKRAKETIAQWKENNPDVAVSEVPIDLVTNSASGLDPHISPEAAYAQIKRVAKANNISEDKLVELVKGHIEQPQLGLFGAERVNVLELNIALQKIK
ncbi:MAG: potassium-transporting ATPase subunit KdpC [Ectobacillus sp.]